MIFADGAKRRGGDMNSKKSKEKWGKPKLIVLVKGKQDEAVLAGCKSDGAYPMPASSANIGYCSKITVWWPTGPCNGCSTLTTS